MGIEFRWWDGQGDPADPKTGSPGVASLDVATALVGKVLSGVGGISPGTESFQINFKDGAALWFVAAGSNTLRVLIKRK